MLGVHFVNLAQKLMQKPLVLHLRKDLVRNLKRGHPWVYDDAIASRPDAVPGRWTLLKDKKGKEVAWGFYDPKGQLAFRACVLHKRALLPLGDRLMTGSRFAAEAPPRGRRANQRFSVPER